jgi:hypothetical protein
MPRAASGGLTHNILVKRALLIVLAGVAASASAAGFEDFAAQATFRPDMTAVRAAYQGSRADVEAMLDASRRVVVPLPSLLNNMRRTPAVFKAGGALVHVFGVRAQNNPGLTGWYIGFAVDGGETVFFKGADALHLRKLGVGPDRHLAIKLNGQAFDLQVKVAITNTMKSRVVITPMEKGALPIEFTVAQLAEQVYEAGWPVSLGGRDYRLLYTENILEIPGTDAAPAPPGGRVAPSSDRVIALLFLDGKGGVSGYGWLERLIPRDRPLVTWTVAKGADADGDKGPAFSVMIDAQGRLDLRYLSPAPAKR